MEIYTSRSDRERSEAELNTYKKLNQLNIEYNRIDHDPAATIAECELIDHALGTKMCKNLFLCNTQKNRFYLLLMPGDKRFKTKEVSHALGIARLSFAPDEYLGCHPCVNTSSLKIKMKDILEIFLPHTGHIPTVIELIGE